MPDDKRIFEKQIPYTVVRNEVFDEVMPKVSYPAWKVLCAIIRATMGWHKTEDHLSYSQLLKRTGIGSPSTLSSAVEELVTGGYVNKNGDRMSGDPNTYELNEDYVLILGTTIASVDPPPCTTTATVEVGLQKVYTQNKPLNKDTTTREPTLSSIWFDAIGQTGSPMMAEEVDGLGDEYGRDWVVDAIKESVISANTRPSIKYLMRVLERWKAEGKGSKPKWKGKSGGKSSRQPNELTPEQVAQYFPES